MAANEIIMRAQAIARRVWRAGLHCASARIAAVSRMSIATRGRMGLAGALVTPAGAEFGRSAEQVWRRFAPRIALFAPMAPFAAGMAGKCGLRRMPPFAVAMIETGLSGALVMTRAWSLGLSRRVIVGFGAGSTAIALAATVTEVLA